MAKTVPLATNSLNSLGTYFHRKIYKHETYPKDIATPIDLWYEKFLYGKLDTLGNIVSLSEASLRQVKTGDGSPVYALSFVIDAYEEMRNEYMRAYIANKIDRNSRFKQLIPESGWTSLNIKYHNYIGVLYEAFYEYASAPGVREKILNFDSFVSSFLDFIDSISYKYPFTRCSFVTSVFCSHDTTGLVLGVTEDNHSDDENKYSEFIKDPNFLFVSNLARKYGFYMDKNAPWRFVADLGSKQLKPFIDKENINSTQQIFNKFYYNVKWVEIDSMVVYITQFYNSYVNSSPTVTIPKPSNKRNQETAEEVFTRTPVDVDSIRNIYGVDFWLRLFFYIRSKETKKEMTQTQYDAYCNKIISINKNLKSHKAMDYIMNNTGINFIDIDNGMKYTKPVEKFRSNYKFNFSGT